jgi:hypothetical protein
MAIDIAHEEVFSLTEGAKRLPRRRGDKKTHVSTLHRWATIGLHGVKLETLACGGVRCTSLQALQRFFDRLTIREPIPANSHTAPDLSVEAELDRAGI